MAGDFSAIEGASLCLLPERLDTAAAPALKALLEHVHFIQVHIQRL